MVKNPPADAGDRFDPWVEKMPWRRNGNPLQILAWRIPWTEEPGGLHTVHGVAKESDTTW